jgi:hypothetical protein
MSPIDKVAFMRVLYRLERHAGTHQDMRVILEDAEVSEDEWYKASVALRELLDITNRDRIRFQTRDQVE